jgi:hypothetical protein
MADRCACNFRVADRPFIQSADPSRIAVVWLVATVIDKPARLPIHDQAVEKLDTTKVSGIGDLMRDIAGERAGAVIPAFFLFRVRL